MTPIKSISFCIRTSGEREDYLERAIRSIHFQKIDIPYDVLVYGYTRLDQRALNFRFIEGVNDAKNARYGKMLNKLAEHSDKEILVYMDDDSEFLPYWWSNVKNLDTELFGITCYKLYQIDGSWGLYDWFDYSEIIPGKSRRKDWNEEVSATTYIGAGAMIVKRSIVLKIQFDGGGGEDGRFSMKAIKAGHILKAFPFMKNAICIHFLCKRGRNTYNED